MKKTVSALLMVLLCATAGFAGSAGFNDNGNGTVTDLTTNLVWQQCSDGQSAAGCTGAAATVTWDNAISYCESLSLGGFTDWRLPKMKELQSIVDMTRVAAPAINATYFPNTQSSNYWSSTTFAPGAWVVQFSNGGTGASVKTSNSPYVRCVRGH